MRSAAVEKWSWGAYGQQIMSICNFEMYVHVQLILSRFSLNIRSYSQIQLTSMSTIDGGFRAHVDQYQYSLLHMCYQAILL
ncbi:hypothetical protein QG37_04806 [Candidozyma auris]|nr:hypothetical protein QG37_04806 [[Candida] auris]